MTTCIDYVPAVAARALDMHLLRRMQVKPGIDRRKHEVDVLEQVLKGVHAESAEHRSGERVVDVAVRPWDEGIVASAAQVRDDDEEE